MFYLILGFIIIPLAAKVVIPWQGSKILKTPVKVRSVFVNPLLIQLKINGLAILDHNKQTLLGFESFFVDASFLQLFKKTYRIEDVSLKGLQVNAALLSDGRINLMEIVPQGSPAEEQSQQKAAAEGAVSDEKALSSEGQAPAEAKPLPLVVVDRIALENGTVRFEDQSVEPKFSTSLNGMQLEVTGFSTQPEAQTKVAFKAKLDEKGIMAVDALIKPLAQPLAMETSFSLNDYAMQVVTPYVGKYTGRGLQDGKLDVKMDYRINDNQLTASHKLLIQHFEFGQTVESKDALPLPFGLAVALLEDPQGRINISLPVSGDMSDPQFEYFHLIGQVARNFFMKLVTKPFSVLASMMGGSDTGTDELGYVRFSPGRADLSEEEKQKLGLLIKGLNERPKLRLEINGGFDQQVDWKAIQADIFTRDYEELRKDSSREETVAYQLLYQRRFGIRALWDLTKKYKLEVAQYEEEKLNQEIKRQLIEHAPPDEQALAVLAQARAQVVYDFFIASGFDAGRLKIGATQKTQSSMGYVPMEFTLTVFEQ